MGKSFRIGKIFGIPLMLDFSWFLGFILFVLILATDLLPAAYPYWSGAYHWIIAILTILLLFASVVVHELAHSAVSRKTGIPVKSITLFILGGVAQIDRESSRPKTELVMSLAGPLSSLLLAGIFYGLAYLFDGRNDYLFAITHELYRANLVLAAFNMLPGFPMDGGRVLRSIVWMIKKNYLQATRIAIRIGIPIFICFIAWGFYLTFNLNLVGGFLFIFIGFYMINAGRITYQHLLMRETLKGYTAQDVMTLNLPHIPRNLNLLDLIEGTLVKSNNSLYLVTDGESIVGTLTRWQVKKVPQKQWSITTVAHIMIPVEQLKTVRPSDEASAIFEKFDQGQDDAVAVSNEGKILGIIARHTLFDFAQRLQVLKG